MTISFSSSYRDLKFDEYLLGWIFSPSSKLFGLFPGWWVKFDSNFKHMQTINLSTEQRTWCQISGLFLLVPSSFFSLLLFLLGPCPGSGVGASSRWTSTTTPSLPSQWLPSHYSYFHLGKMSSSPNVLIPFRYYHFNWKILFDMGDVGDNYSSHILHLIFYAGVLLHPPLVRTDCASSNGKYLF